MTKNHLKYGFLIAIFSMSQYLTFSQTESIIENHPGVLLERTETSYPTTMMMINKQLPADPVSIIQAFNDCINKRDIDGLAALMSEDHTFIDRDG
jgi:hypothetical protein